MDRMTEMIASARSSVDIAYLYEFGIGSPGCPDGGFDKALVDGLNQGHRMHPEDVPLVRILIGVYAGTPNLTACIAKLLSGASGDWLKIQYGYMHTAAYSWNHAKVLDVDGKQAIVGGMNYWAGDYLDTSHPTNDVSMWVSGPAALDASHFTDMLWKFTCGPSRHIPLSGTKVEFFDRGRVPKCIENIHKLPVFVDSNGRTIMVVGKLGHGLDVPGEQGKQSAPIVRPKLSGNTCNADQAGEDNKDVNNKRDYEYRNPGETALRALIASAKNSIFISQQDLLSCLPTPWAATEAKFDERVFAALAQKVVAGIPIKIVLSSFSTPPGGYSNGWQLPDVAEVFMQMLQKNDGLSAPAARQKLCQDVGLTTIRNAASAAAWADGTNFYNHAKVVEVDDEAFYIGSGNLYPSGLQELGFIVDDRAAAAHLKEAYLDPLWNNSRPSALIDPNANKCGAFPGGAAQLRTVQSTSRTFAVRADTTKTLDVSYPALANSRHYCQVRVSGPGRGDVKILSRHLSRGGIEGPRLELLRAGTVCTVKVRDNATRRSPDTTANVKVTATAVRNE